MVGLFAATWAFKPGLSWIWLGMYFLPFVLSWVARVTHPWLIRRTAGGPGYSMETALEIQRYLDKRYDRDGWSWEFSGIRFLETEGPCYEIRFTDCGRLRGILRLKREEAGAWVPRLVEDQSDESPSFWGDSA